MPSLTLSVSPSDGRVQRLAEEYACVRVCVSREEVGLNLTALERLALHGDSETESEAEEDSESESETESEESETGSDEEESEEESEEGNRGAETTPLDDMLNVLSIASEEPKRKPLITE